MANDTAAVRSVVGLFESAEQADRAADELRDAGFSGSEVGIISGHELSRPERHVTADENSEGKVMSAMGKGLAAGGGLGALAGGLSALLVPGIGPLVVGGAIAATMLGAGLGASVGGVMAGLMKAGVNESDARLFETALRHGGVVLTVHTDDQRAGQAVEILNRFGALDLDEHRQKFSDMLNDRPPEKLS